MLVFDIPYQRRLGTKLPSHFSLFHKYQTHQSIMHFIHPLHYIASKITISGYIPFTQSQDFIYRNIKITFYAASPNNIKIHEIIPSSAMPKFLSGGYILIAVTIKAEFSQPSDDDISASAGMWLAQPPSPCCPAACH